ncbi:YbfB/YjiJ family MFS transporter [Lampropedia puyangensis]|uniref:YbfB/YjiJ family MFS transporter n=1 Tax=Lampropedia puyangensis TaxID=1330072 RepID=A0A4S8FAQ9_9BURK|nr:YbfB/YjiJ family MFS transporter [Lampropedia puyangensis]THU04570.1 YbfB/YjiJ family MFS transporter [Lampropedia puyangensis]
MTAHPNASSTPSPQASPSAFVIAITGAISLACAMGLGRFAFTPMLPLMVHDGLVDLPGGSWLATLNYIGYLLGALACMALPLLLRNRTPIQLRQLTLPLMTTGLLGTTALLFCMALPWHALWALARTAAGIVSAFAFVYTTAWCLEQLAARNANQLGGLIYTGPGIGIVVSGLVVSKMALWQAHAQVVWAVMGCAAVVLTTFVLHVVRRASQHERATPSARTSSHSSTAAQTVHGAPWTAEHILLTIAYGLAGFGYIITATYLPVIAHSVMPDSSLIALFWPIFGLSIAVGAASTRLIAPWRDRRSLLVISYLLQACGVVLPLFLANSMGFILGSILLGLPFTALTLFAMQEVRRLRPLQAAPFIGALTTLYGMGQIAGPPLVVWLLGHAQTQQQGFAIALSVAAASLILGAVLFWLLRWRYPTVPHQQGQ